MTIDDRSEKVALLFGECLEIETPSERMVFLETACEGCSEIREEVERLLLAYEASGSFLNGGAPVEAELSTEATGLSAADLEPEGCVGPYRLMGLIGEGNTSTVFLAEQEEPVHRWVALKIVKPGMDSRKVILRFGLERQALALMDHPGIARLLDAGATSSGRPFFVMELVSGISITRYCDEHQLTVSERLKLFNEICNAVTHAHQRGIIHRDIKPDNILVCNYDERTVLKIIDFGIAKVLHSWGLEDATRTGTTPLLGTPAYMSPEQVRMTSSELDTRTDIYSLGALLYELLTGHPPFDNEELLKGGIEGMCRLIRTVEPMPPSIRVARADLAEQSEVASTRGTTPKELRRRLSGDLDAIALKALEKPCDQRYATVACFVEDISRHVGHLPVSAAPSNRRYRFVKLLRRNKKLVSVAGFVGAVLLGSAVVSVSMAVNARHNANQARYMEQAAFSAERESHRAMVAMHVSSGLSAAEDRFSDKAVLWFANAARVDGKGGYSSEVNALRAMSWMSEVPLPIGAFKLSSTSAILEFSSDSRYLLALDRKHNWQLWDVQGQDLVTWTAGFGPIKAAAWSPEGARLALVRASGTLHVYEATTGQLLRTHEAAHAPETIGFTPDSRYLVYGGEALHVLDLESDTPAEEISQYSKAFVGLTFSAQSTKLVGVTHDDEARIFDIGKTGQVGIDEPMVFPHQHVIRMDTCPSKTKYREDFLEAGVLSLPALVSQGTRLLTRTGPYDITSWDAVTGDSVRTIDGVCCSCRFITSPEAGLFACGLQGGKVGVWDIVTGEPYQVIPSKGACILDMAFGMSGKSLITAEANGMARLWSVDQSKELQSPLHHSMDVDKVAYSNSGGVVATAQSDGLVRVWAVLEGEPDGPTRRKRDVPNVVRLDRAGSNFVFTKEPSLNFCTKETTVYSAQTGGIVGETLRFDSCVETAAFSPQSDTLAVGLGSFGNGSSGQMEFRDLANTNSVGQSIGLDSEPVSIAWDPTGEIVATICRSGELLSFRPESGETVWLDGPTAIPLERMNPVTAFTPDGRTLVSLGPDGTIQVRESSSGNLRYIPLESQPDGFWSFELSRDSLHMATATVGGEVVVWDLYTGLPTGDALVHPGWVYQCRFSPDDDTLVTASHDGNVRMWNWRSGELLVKPLVHPGEVYDAKFTPDNRWLLTTCQDGNVRVWDPRTGIIVAPPLKVGGQAFNIEMTKDGDRAVVGSFGEGVSILSLENLKAALPYDMEDLCLIGEVVSGCSIQEGTIRDLTTAEWMERYKRLRRLHPEVLIGNKSYALERLAVEKTGIF